MPGFNSYVPGTHVHACSFALVVVLPVSHAEHCRFKMFVPFADMYVVFIQSFQGKQVMPSSLKYVPNGHETQVVLETFVWLCTNRKPGAHPLVQRGAFSSSECVPSLHAVHS